MSAAPEVKADVKIVPAKRTASYAVPVNENTRHDVVAEVRAGYVVLKGGSDGNGKTVSLPKTIAAVVAVSALLEAVREELIAQGVTE